MDRTNHKSGYRLTLGELELLKLFIKMPWKNFTLTEMKKMAGKTSYHYVYDALNKFAGKRIITIEKRGNTNLYQLNFKEDDAVSYLEFVEFLIKNERSDIPFKNINKMQEKIKSCFYSLIITGSYAEKKQMKSSDIDVVIIIPDSDEKRIYETALKEGELMIPEVHGFVFRESEFFKMLINKEFNLGKETARKHIIAFGGESYYKILFRAMENEFAG